MLNNYSNFEGLRVFSRAFGSSSYNSSGGSMYSVLDSSKKYASVGKKVLSFSKSDSVALKERKDAETYGVGLSDFYKKTAEDQIKAPDAVKQPKYTGDSGEPREGDIEGSVGSEGSEESGSNEGAELPDEAEFEIEPIESEAFADLSEKQAMTFRKRASMAKAMPEFKGMNIKLYKTKTKPSLDIYVPNKEVKRALISHFEILASEKAEGNLKKFFRYLSGGAAFKIKEGSPAPTFELRKKEPRAKKSKSAKAEAAAPAAAPAAAAAAAGAAEAGASRCIAGRSRGRVRTLVAEAIGGSRGRGALRRCCAGHGRARGVGVGACVRLCARRVAARRRQR